MKFNMITAIHLIEKMNTMEKVTNNRFVQLWMPMFLVCIIIIAFRSTEAHSRMFEMQYQSADTLNDEVFRSAMDWGDYDNDGDLDVVLVGAFNTIVARSELLKNNGDGTFTKDETASATIEAVSLGDVQWYDYDNDGDLDLLVTGRPTSTGTAVVTNLYDNSNGVLTLNSSISSTFTDVYNSSAKWGDFNNDGFTDVMISGQQINASVLTKLYKNNGNGTFTNSAASSTFDKQSYSNIDWGDIDGDNDLDVIISGSSDTYIYINNGDETFTKSSASSTISEHGEVAFGDYDNDGDLDVIVSGNSGTSPVTKLYDNDGAGVFSENSAASTIFVDVRDAMLDWADFDSDGDLDLIIAGEETATNLLGGGAERTDIYINTNGVFTRSSISDSIEQLYDGDLQFVDYNNNGRMDLYISGNDSSALNGESNGISVLYTDLTTSVNTAPTAPTNLISSITNDSLLFSWTASTDTEGGPLEYNLFIINKATNDTLMASNSDHSNGFRKVIHAGNAGLSTSFKIKTSSLEDGPYTWGVQTIDGGGKSSAFSTINTAPTASNLSITGNLENQQILTANYTYTDASNVPESGTTIQWYRSDDNSGTNKAAIDGATSSTYTISLSDEFKYFSFQVIPRNGSVSGLTYESSLSAQVVTPATVPIASNVVFTGDLDNDSVLTVSYTFFDLNGDSESGSTYVWYRSDDGSGTNKAAIAGATSQTYTVANADENKFLSVEVTPSDGALFGSAEESSIQGPVVSPAKAPVVSSLSITSSATLDKDTVLNASYTYFDLNGDAESGTSYIWYRSDDDSGTNKAAISGETSQSYTLVNADENTFISVEVTPSDGVLIGSSLESALLDIGEYPERAPSIIAATFSGTVLVGETVTGVYTYSDPNGDDESGSTYQWYVADDNSGTGKVAISGATQLTYTYLESDKGKYISFEVTPSDGTNFGNSFETALIGPIPGFTSGIGTTGDPFMVSTLDELQLIKSYQTKHYKLQNTIDASPTKTWNKKDGSSEYSGFLPIGTLGFPFTGTFDGAGFKIDSLYIDDTSLSYVGLFGNVTSSASIEDIGLTNVYIMGGDNVGGIIGRLGSGTSITKSYSTGTVEGSDRVGGLVGYLQATITLSYSEVDVTGAESVGGLVGESLGTAVITNAYASGEVNGTDKIGAFIGNVINGTISNSYAFGRVGSVASGKLKGGFEGRDSLGSYTNNYWNGESTNSGNRTSAGATKLTSSEMTDSDSFTSWDFSTIWNITEDQSFPYLRDLIPTSLPGINLTDQSGIIIISTLTQLQAMKDSLSANYKLGQDIDASATSGWNESGGSFLGFEPIGDNSTPFTGDFDGKGYKITGLYINRPTQDYVGLFGKTEGDIEDLGIIRASIEGKDYVGALAGSIDNTFSSNFNENYSKGEVKGNNNVGGLFGFTNAKIHRSFSKAEVTGNNYVGGLVGNTDSFTITDSYATGAVTGNAFIGGMAGDLNSNGVGSANNERIYSTGKVTGNSQVGAIAGASNTAYNSFYNSETSGVSGVLFESTSRSSLEMIQDSSFSTSNIIDGFTFDNSNWSIINGYTYPYLSGIGNDITSVLTISGSEGWRLMSPPSNQLTYGELLEPLWTQGFTGADSETGTSNVYTWNESQQQYVSIQNSTDSVQVGVGLLVYVFADSDKDGNAETFPRNIIKDMEIYSSETTFPLDLTDDNDAGTTLDGWNLIGNPYPFPINWTNSTHGSGWGKQAMFISMYIWNASAGEYQSHNGTAGTFATPDIAPWQGFWVKSELANTPMTVDENAKSTAGTFNKSTLTVPEIRFTLKELLVDSSDALKSGTMVMFSEYSTTGLDELDSYKLQSLNAEFLSLFTTLNTGENLDINSLPDSLNEPITVKLKYDGSNISGEYELTWNHKLLPEDWEFILTDTRSGEEVNLKNEDSYIIDEGASKRISRAKNIFSVPEFGLVKQNLSKSATNSDSRFTLTISPSQTVSNEIEVEEEQPIALALDQNYPNPFNPFTTINYAVPVQSKVRLEVFDLVGRKVAELVNGPKSAGLYTINFDASQLASGLYIYRLQVGGKVLTRKMTLIK
ncbi:MAG: hypothetical protein BalsKO_18910 [Balneolaceae bacterium]